MAWWKEAPPGGPADDDAIVTALYAQYREPLMTFVMRFPVGNQAQAESRVYDALRALQVVLAERRLP